MIAAVVPAAGRSNRMGQPKLLLEFAGEPLIRKVVTALRTGGVQRVVVIVPSADAPESAPLAQHAAAAGAEVIVPLNQPPEMRFSVEFAISHLSRPTPPTSLLLTPADSPGIASNLVATVCSHALAAPDQIIIPTHVGKRGHPVLFPWDIVATLPHLEPNLGLNTLVARNAARVLEVPVDDPQVLLDLDTPDDLARWTASSTTSLKASVRFFAVARERVGHSEAQIDLATPASVADLRASLAERWPELAPLWSTAMIAVDEEYADDQTPITPTSRLAVIPPVSGGVDGPKSPESTS